MSANELMELARFIAERYGPDCEILVESEEGTYGLNGGFRVFDGQIVTNKSVVLL